MVTLMESRIENMDVVFRGSHCQPRLSVIVFVTHRTLFFAFMQQELLEVL